MARIVGVDLPSNKRGEIALTYIYGIGRSSARAILSEAGIDYDLKVKDWNDDQLGAVRKIIGTEYKVEGELRSSVQMNIKSHTAKSEIKNRKSKIKFQFLYLNVILPFVRS